MLIIRNGKVFTMTGKIVEKGYIIAKEGRIVAIGDSWREAEIREYTKGLKEELIEIDAGEGYIFPGFIDAHCHVGMWEDSVADEGADGNEDTDPVTPHLRAIDGIYHEDRAFVEARENGITTVVTGPGSANVIGGQFAAVKTYGRRIEEMVLKDPVAIKVAFGENPKRVYAEKKQMPSTRMATAAILRENLLKAAEYGKHKEEYEQDKKKKDKPELDMKMEVLLKALKGEVPVKAHAHRADDILTAIRIAKEFKINLTIEHCTEGHLIADILKDEGICAVIGPYFSERSKIELRNQTAKTPGILSKAGVKVAIMSDHPCTPIQYLPIYAAMAVKEGMDEYEALRAITINAAEICGIADRVGSLAAGKDADIVIFDKHPFDLMARVRYTIINGRVVYSASC